MNWLSSIVAPLLNATASIGNIAYQGYTVAKDFPWRKIFAWTLVAGTVYYFFGLLWYGFKAVFAAFSFLGSASNLSSAGSPNVGLLGTSLQLSAFWDILNGYLPDFWRWFMWWIAGDWAIFLGINILHMKIIGAVVDRLLVTVAVTIHKVFNNL